MLWLVSKSALARNTHVLFITKVVFKLTQNVTPKLQFNGFLFSGRVVSSCLRWRSHHCLCLVLWTFYLFRFYIFLSIYLRVSRTFLLYKLGITTIALGWIQLNCQWHSLVCSVAPDDSQLPFMLSCWCSIHVSIHFFFDLPIYLPCMSSPTSVCFDTGCFVSSCQMWK